MIRLKTTSKACHDVTPIRTDQPVNRLTDPLIVSRNFLVILTAVLVLIGSIGGSWLLVEPINEQREELQLTFSDEATRNMPPAAAIAQAALGSFRGVVVNFLWIRAQQLKQEGRFHEAVQRPSSIGRKDPLGTEDSPGFPHEVPLEVPGAHAQISVHPGLRIIAFVGEQSYRAASFLDLRGAILFLP
jgi:hypothetical protein